MTEMIVYIVIGLLAVLVIVLLVALLKKQDNGSDIKDYIDRELEQKQLEQRQYNNQMLQSIVDIKAGLSNDLLGFNSKLNNDFTVFSERTVNTLNQLEEKINTNLKESYKTNNETFTNIQERLTKIDTAQKNIEELSKDINSLQTILTDKKNRGTFGEIELYSLLESAYGIDDQRWQKQYHFDSNTIADAAIIGGESLGIICVDSKFPLENYRRIYDEEIAKEDREKAKTAFKSDVKKHIDAIKNKYIIPGVTAEFAYMFIPAEAIFAEIYGNYQDLCDYSYKSKVYMVSPTTLMAYLTAIKSIYLGQQRDQKAREILKELNALSIEFKRFSERSEKMHKLCGDLNEAFDQFKISTDKITKKFDKINSGDFKDE